MSRRLSPDLTVGIASLLSCALTLFAGIGAPPSTISEEAGLWLALEPIQVPLLVVGFLLVFAAFFAALGSARAGGWLCIAGLWCSWLGAVIGLGLENRTSILSVLVLAGIWATPTLIAIDGIKASRRSPQNVHAG